MPQYQLFFLTSENKAVKKLEETHENEFRVLSKARDHTIDVWQDNRRVAMIAPGAEPLVFSDHRAR